MNAAAEKAQHQRAADERMRQLAEGDAFLAWFMTSIPPQRATRAASALRTDDTSTTRETRQTALAGRGEVSEEESGI